MSGIEEGSSGSLFFTEDYGWAGVMVMAAISPAHFIISLAYPGPKCY